MKVKIGITVLGILLVIFLINWAYHAIHNEHWNDQSEAIRRAYEETDMVKAEQVKYYTGEASYHIVIGKDHKGQKMLVWVGANEDDIHTEYAKDGLKESEIKQLVIEKEGSLTKLLRITPGKMNGEYIWEVFYKKEETQGERYYYDLYDFSNGTLLDTYKLGVQTD